MHKTVKNRVSSLIAAALTVLLSCFANGHVAFAGPGAARDQDPGWAAGLSVYVGGPGAEQSAKEDWRIRKKLLLEYGTRVSEKNEVSLKELRGLEGPPSRAIGLGKAALVFHALRRLAGDAAFSRIERTLATGAPAASWADIRSLFENETGLDLGWFFAQWVDRTGLPDLRVESAAVRRNGGKFEVSFDLVQKGDVYVLDIPVTITFLSNGSRTENVKLDNERKHIVLAAEEEPATVVVDGEYDVPRKLSDAETPPYLEKVLYDESTVLVISKSGQEIFSAVRDAWLARGAVEREASVLKDAEVGISSLVIFGEDNQVIRRLYGRYETGAGELVLEARKNPWGPGHVVVMVQARSDKASAGALQAVIENGDCSSLTVDAQGRMRKQTAPSERGIMAHLRDEPAAIDMSALGTLGSVIEKASDKKIVYVGEYHDRFAHHQVQLQVIKVLHRKDPKIAVGLEMFQRPFQKALDDFVSGAIDEREFLKRSEYFKRWSLDYNFYKPILDFARAEKIPVVALNIRSEISGKVSKSGMDSLSDEERAELPAELDFSDTGYRDRLRQVFEEHKSKGERNFDFFYQAQIIWDEGMARSIDEYLKKNSDQRMVVVAGLGHLFYGSGIPQRSFRRNGYSYTTILNDADVERGIGDFLVFPQALEGSSAPKLMAVLKETTEGVGVVDLPEDSVSKKAGMRSGDTILALDNERVKSVEEIKLLLFYKKTGESVKVKVLRKRFILSDREMEIEVKL